MEFKGRLDVISMPEAPLPFGFGERVSATIAPTAFGHEFIPDFNFFVARPAALFETPVEDLLVGPAAQDLLRQCAIIDMQKTRASRVEPGPHFGSYIVAFGKLAGGLKPNFVQHSAEVNNSAYFFV
jgi:hypothetical protein